MRPVRPAVGRQRFSIRTALLIVVLGTSAISCSSDSKGDSATADGKSPSTFTSSVNDATRKWATEAASRFFDEVVKESPLTSEIEAFNENGIVKTLCSEIESFEPDDREGSTFDSRSDAVDFAKKSALDSAVAGLLGHAFAGDTTLRDQQLAALKVGQSASQSVNPIESMSAAGLLDAAGKPVVPPTELISSDPEGPYEKYRDWLSKGSPALLSSGSALIEGIDRAVDACGSKKT